MGADLYVCVETLSAQNVNHWSLAGYFPMCHRGPEEDLIRRSGEAIKALETTMSECNARLVASASAQTLDALLEDYGAKYEGPYWIASYDGADFVALIDRWLGRPWPMFEEDDELSGYFGVDCGLRAAVACSPAR